MSGIKITSLENGFLVSNGSMNRKVCPTLPLALSSVLNSLESFGGYTTVEYQIDVVPKHETTKLHLFEHTKNLSAMIERVDNGFFMSTYFEPTTRENRKDYGFTDAGELIKQVFRSFHLKLMLRARLAAKKRVTDSVTCPGGPKITKRTVVVLKEHEEKDKKIKISA